MTDARSPNPASLYRDTPPQGDNPAKMFRSSLPSGAGPNPAALFKGVQYKPEMNTPPSGIWEGLKGAVSGAYEKGKEAAMSVNPLKPTPEQEEDINTIQNPYLKRAAISAYAVPETAQNLFNYGSDVLTSAIGGAVGGATAGYKGQPENREQLIESAKREAQYISEAELANLGSRMPEHPQPRPERAKPSAPTAPPNPASLYRAAPSTPAPEGPLGLPENKMLRLPAPSTIYPEVHPGQVSEPWKQEYGSVKGIQDKMARDASRETLQNRVIEARTQTPDVIYAGKPPPPEPTKLPEAPKDAGAAAVREQDRPPLLSRDQFVSEVEDDLNRLKTNAAADKLDVLAKAKALPEEARNAKLQERLNMHGEGDPNAKLTPAETKIFDEHIAPMREENREMTSRLMEDGLVEDIDAEGYMRRIPKGRGSRLDPFAGDYVQADPIKGSRTGLGAGPKPTESRVYHVIEDDAGHRKVVALRDGELYLPSKEGKETPMKAVQPIRIGNDRNTRLPAQKDIQKGDRVFIDGKQWDIKDAYTREIEEQTPTEYHKNAFANMADANVGLKAAVRTATDIKRLKGSPDFEQFARPVGSKDIPKGWRKTQFPLFKDQYLEPKVAEALDDFWAVPDKPIWEKLAAVNRYANQSLFWSPTKHALNAFGHWYSARGWDNFTPPGMKRMVQTGAQAMKEVTTLGPKYRQLLREGNSLLYGGVVNQKFYETLLKRVGEDVKANPAKWDPIARTLGVGPSTLVEMVYSGASKALWAASDMFMMQRVLELEKKGMSTREAIKDAERHIINYRVPTRVMGSRTVQEALKNPSITQFSRYHYGMMKSIAHIAKDIATGSPKEKFEAAGNIVATGALMFIWWPLINAGIEKLSGSKGLTVGSPGSTTVPQGLLDMWHGDKTLSEFVQSLVTIAPGTKEVVSQAVNKDLFTGKPISEPEDERELRGDKAVLQRAEHLAEGLVQPYSLVSKNLKGESLGEGLKGLGKDVLLQGIGLSDKSPEKLAGKEKAKQIQAKEGARRARKPPGALERAIYGE